MEFEIIDTKFVELYYKPLLNLENIDTTNKNTLTQFILENRSKIKWVNYNDFIANTQFDYKYYSVYNNIDFVESHCIYHYINHGVFDNFATNLNMQIAQQNKNIILEETVKHISGSILIVTHELSLTGGGLVAIELHDYYKSMGCDVDIMKLRNVDMFVSKNVSVIKKDNLNDIKKKYDYVVINTIDTDVQKWCKSNIEHMDKFVLWLHEVSDTYYDYDMDKLNFKYVVMDSYHAYNVFIQKSKFVNQVLKVLYLPNPLHISSLTIEEKKYYRSTLRKKYEIPLDSTVFLNIGTLCKHKAQIEVVYAIEKYMLDKMDKLNFVFAIVGDKINSILDYIWKSPNKHALRKCIRVLPFISHANSNQYYAMSDVYISSAHTEVYGKVIVEAMELSLPIVGFAGGSHLELIKHDYNGLLYKTEKELANHIETLCKNKSLIGLYGKQAHWFYKLKIPTITNFFNIFTSMLEISKKQKCFNIKLEKQITNNQFKRLEASSWINNNNMFLFGGYDERANAIDTIYKINLNTLEIVCESKIPTDCAKTHLLAINNKNDVYIVSGQSENGYGKATDKVYMYSHTNKCFVCKGVLPLKRYDMRGIIDGENVIAFSGALEDRSTPNCDVIKLKLFGDDEIESNNKNIECEISTSNFIGSVHSSFVKCDVDKYLYIGGCQCHACTPLQNTEWHMYIHNQKSYILNNKLCVICNTEKQQFQVSHAGQSTFYDEDLNAVIVIGGQCNYDNVYHGVQIYYVDYDLWANITIDKSIESIFNKGCVAFTKDNKLYVLGGQMKSMKFSNTLSIFNIQK